MWDINRLDRARMLNFDKFTERSKGFIQAAQMVALNQHHQTLMVEHLLKALLDDKEGLAANLIRTAGGDPKKVIDAVNEHLEKTPKIYATGSADQAAAFCAAGIASTMPMR